MSCEIFGSSSVKNAIGNLIGITLNLQIAFGSVQFSCSHVQLFVAPWTAECQASLSITNSQSLLKLMSIESVMPSNHLVLCCSLLLLPSIFPSTQVFANELAVCIRRPKMTIGTLKSYDIFLMLKLKLQYFGHLMRKADSFEKTLMLGKIEGRRRRG